MTQLTYQVPEIGNENFTEAPKIASALSDILGVVNGDLDASNMNLAGGASAILSGLGLAFSGWTGVSTFTNGWTGAGAAYGSIPGLGIAFLSGSLLAGSDQFSAFTLPSNLRPGAGRRFSIANYAAGPIAEPGYIVVNTDGTVVPYVTSTYEVGLDGAFWFIGI